MKDGLSQKCHPTRICLASQAGLQFFKWSTVKAVAFYFKLSNSYFWMGGEGEGQGSLLRAPRISQGGGFPGSLDHAGHAGGADSSRRDVR